MQSLLFLITICGLQFGKTVWFCFAEYASASSTQTTSTILSYDNAFHSFMTWLVLLGPGHICVQYGQIESNNWLEWVLRMHGLVLFPVVSKALILTNRPNTLSRLQVFINIVRVNAHMNGTALKAYCGRVNVSATNAATKSFLCGNGVIQCYILPEYGVACKKCMGHFKAYWHFWTR